MRTVPVRPTRTLRPRRPVAAAGLAVAGLLAAGTLAGCGGGSDTATATASGAATAAAGQAGPGGVDFEEIEACLTAAGISMPTPSGQPSGAPSGTPTDAPSGAAGGPPDGQGGPGGGMFSDPEVTAALEACGLDVPTPGAPPSGTPSPSATS